MTMPQIWVPGNECAFSGDTLRYAPLIATVLYAPDTLLCTQDTLLSVDDELYVNAFVYYHGVLHGFSFQHGLTKSPRLVGRCVRIPTARDPALIFSPDLTVFTGHLFLSDGNGGLRVNPERESPMIISTTDFDANEDYTSHCVVYAHGTSPMFSANPREGAVRFGRVAGSRISERDEGPLDIAVSDFVVNRGALVQKANGELIIDFEKIAGIGNPVLFQVHTGRWSADPFVVFGRAAENIMGGASALQTIVDEVREEPVVEPLPMSIQQKLVVTRDDRWWQLYTAEMSKYDGLGEHVEDDDADCISKPDILDDVDWSYVFAKLTVAEARQLHAHMGAREAAGLDELVLIVNIPA